MNVGKFCSVLWNRQWNRRLLIKHKGNWQLVSWWNIAQSLQYLISIFADVSVTVMFLNFCSDERGQKCPVSPTFGGQVHKTSGPAVPANAKNQTCEYYQCLCVQSAAKYTVEPKHSANKVVWSGSARKEKACNLCILVNNLTKYCNKSSKLL
jgi:hypothetical protein